MMNYIWGFMLIAGIVVSLATGRADAFTDSFLASCTDAVEFTLPWQESWPSGAV